MRKKWLGILIGIALLCLCAAALADVELNETNFPDENFRAVVQNYDTDGNGSFSEEEIVAVTYISCIEKQISSLQGVEYFTALTRLECGANQLTSLDISKNAALTKLNCHTNQLTNLDVSKNTALTELQCHFNQLTSLDVSKNTALTELDCYANQLTSLDVSRNTALTDFSCGANQLTSLDVSKNTALVNIRCDQNWITSLDVSKNTALVSIRCEQNRITSLDVSKNTALEYLDCSFNQLTTLDVSKNTALTELICGFNQLTTLDVSKNTALKILQCNENQITRLNISTIPVLNDLVKETQPGTKEDYGYGYGWWHDGEDGWPDIGLFVDESVKVITDGEETKTDIGDAKVMAIKAQVYTGKTIKPAVTVKYDGKKLTGGKDYTVAFKNNKKIGTATVTITGTGDFTGKKTVTFDIIPKGVKLSSLTAGKKTLAVKWAKGKNITGYEIEYGLKKNFKGAKSVTIKMAATTKTVLKKLQAKKVYYVRIRTYKTVSGKKYYSAWSSIKAKKTK